jgi:RNA polymerase-binding transcription factor DksA
MEFKKLLLDARAALLRQLHSVAPAPSIVLDRDLASPGDDGDAAAAGPSADDDAAVAAHDYAELVEVDAALRLLEEEPEQFGVCTVCGRRIEIGRLKIVPTTRVCGRHADTR